MRDIRILLVEDNQPDVGLLEEYLALTTEASYPLTHVDSLAACLKVLNSSDFDIVLLGLNKPRMSGQDVLRKLSQDQNLLAIPLVVLTTSDDEKDIVNSYANNANCYISKPVNFTQFFDVVKSIDSLRLKVVKLPATNTIN